MRRPTAAHIKLLRYVYLHHIHSPGNVVCWRSSTDSQGSTTNYDSRGKVISPRIIARSGCGSYRLRPSANNFFRILRFRARRADRRRAWPDCGAARRREDLGYGLRPRLSICAL